MTTSRRGFLRTVIGAPILALVKPKPVYDPFAHVTITGTRWRAEDIYASTMTGRFSELFPFPHSYDIPKAGKQVAAFHKDLAAVMASPSPFSHLPSSPGGSMTPGRTTEDTSWALNEAFNKAGEVATAAEELQDAIENEDAGEAKEKLKELNHAVAQLQELVNDMPDYSNSDEDADGDEDDND